MSSVWIMIGSMHLGIAITGSLANAGLSDSETPRLLVDDRVSDS